MITAKAAAPVNPTAMSRRTRGREARSWNGRSTKAIHLNDPASAQHAPADRGRLRLANTTAPSAGTIIQTSFCPPPAKWIAKSGFQPTAAAAKAGRGESTAASATRASIPAPATIR